MGLFSRKKGDVLDLTERYRKQQEQLANIREEASQPTQASKSQEFSGGIGIFGIPSNTPSTNSNSESEVLDLGTGMEDKRRKLAKRLMDMTNKIEDLSNQIYHLQQRIEVLERKGSSY